MPTIDKILSATMRNISNLLKVSGKKKKNLEEEPEAAWICAPTEISPQPTPELEKSELPATIFDESFKQCYTPTKAILNFGRELTTFEMAEIFDYQSIYFVGLKSSKGHSFYPTFSRNAPHFKNDEGFYLAYPNDHVAYRYEILEELGKGAFGIVYKALDHKTGQYVALKIVREGDRSRSQAEDEIRILEIIQDCDPSSKSHASRMLDYFTFRDHLCIAFELLDKSLFEILESQPPHLEGFSISTVREIAIPLLECLKFLHANDLIHCDLKPDNILLDRERKSVKVIDFGLACIAGEDHYAYIQARSYRAPEVFLGAGYSTPIDMWSLGCILAELLTGQALFYGEDDSDHMAAIQEVLGVPTREIWAETPNARHYFSSKGFPRYCKTIGWTANASPVFLNGRRPSGKFRGPPRSRKLRMILGADTDPDFVDFIRRCLDWNPETRLSARDGLNHPWIQNPRSKRSSHITDTLTHRHQFC